MTTEPEYPQCAFPGCHARFSLGLSSQKGHTGWYWPPNDDEDPNLPAHTHDTKEVRY